MSPRIVVPSIVQSMVFMLFPNPCSTKSVSLDRHWHRALSHCVVAEMQIAVVSPALNRAGTRQHASVNSAGSDSDGVRNAVNDNRKRAARRRTIAELAVFVF